MNIRNASDFCRIRIRSLVRVDGRGHPSCNRSFLRLKKYHITIYTRTSNQKQKTNTHPMRDKSSQSLRRSKTTSPEKKRGRGRPATARKACVEKGKVWNAKTKSCRDKLKRGRPVTTGTAKKACATKKGHVWDAKLKQCRHTRSTAPTGRGRPKKTTKMFRNMYRDARGNGSQHWRHTSTKA